MKQGKSLSELAKELERQQEVKRDFVAPKSDLLFEANGKESLKVGDLGRFGVNDLAHEQMASKLVIPKKYYDRMRVESPELLATNVNHWLHNNGKEKMMVRTLDGSARAILSNRYRPLDNYNLAQSVLPILSKMEGLSIQSCEVTEKRLYLKAVTTTISTEVKKGDVVQAGIVISNSEVGCGSVKVEPMIYRLVCLNGMISADHRMRKYHVGKSDNEEIAREFFADETRQQDDRAFWMKVRDIVKASLSDVLFNKIVEKMILSTDRIIEAKPEKVIEVVQDHFSFNEDERSNVLTHLIKGGDLTQYGLMNAVTRASQDSESYDRATELERVGGEILDLTNGEWQKIAA